MLMNEMPHAQPYFPFSECLPCPCSLPPAAVSPASENRAVPRAEKWSVEARVMGVACRKGGGRKKISLMKGARGERAKFLERGPCKERADDIKK